MSDKPKVRKLCARLLKEGFTPEDSMKDGHGLEEGNWTCLPDAVLLTGVSRSRPPKWEEFIREGSSDVPKLRSQNSGALLFIPVEDRWFAFAFGYGFFALRPESYELNFGLRCALNSIEPESLKSLDISTPEQTTIQRRIQTSQAAELGVFGIATEKDILKKIQGKCKNTEFAKNLTGSDALTLSVPLWAHDLQNKCVELLEVYQKEDYRDNFAWVDHIGHVKDKERCAQLDQLLIDHLTEDTPAAHLAPPEIVDPESLEQFKFAGTGCRESFQDLMLGDYLSAVSASGQTLSVESLKQHKVVAVQDDNTQYAKWTVYRCLVFETEYDGLLYVLSGGKWYQIETDFAAEVTEAFQNAIPGPELPSATIGDNEDTYIERLKNNKADWVCLHKQNVKCSNWSSPIEPCDFLTPDDEFLHIKNNAISATLSHLFSQGTVSAEAFKREEEYRESINTKIDDVNPGFHSSFPDPQTPVSPTDYTVVYAVMRKPDRNGEMNLPFFSKVAYRDAHRRLSDLGFNIQFSWVRKSN